MKEWIDRYYAEKNLLLLDAVRLFCTKVPNRPAALMDSANELAAVADRRVCVCFVAFKVDI